MSDFQAFLVFCGVMWIITMAYPSRADRASKPIVAILKALPMYVFSKIAVATMNKNKK